MRNSIISTCIIAMIPLTLTGCVTGMPQNFSGKFEDEKNAQLAFASETHAIKLAAIQRVQDDTNSLISKNPVNCKSAKWQDIDSANQEIQKVLDRRMAMIKS